MAQQIFLGVQPEASRSRCEIVAGSGEPFARHWRIGVIGAAVSGRFFRSVSGTKLEADAVSAEELEFWRQKEAFLSIPAEDLAQYASEFVLARDGRIGDHDRVLSELTRRSVENFGDVPVYITYIGGELEFRIDTPFLD